MFVSHLVHPDHQGHHTNVHTDETKTGDSLMYVMFLRYLVRNNTLATFLPLSPFAPVCRRN